MDQAREEDPSLGSSVGASPLLTERLDEALLRLDEFRSRPLAAIGGVVLVIALLAGAFVLARPDSATPVEELIPLVTLVSSETETSTETPLIVHISGAVVAPGVFELTPGSRVIDAISAAGGATPEAELDRLNLAAPLRDGVQVRVPEFGQELSGNPIVDPADSNGTASSASGPVDINVSSATQLEVLPGVGPAIASAIVAWREEHGPFKSVEGLLSVPGIGSAKLEGLREQAEVNQ